VTVRDQIVAGARRWLGTPYKWGGESEAEGGVDCSGLVIAAYKAAGRPLPGRPVASGLGRMGTSVSLAQAKPGDVVYRDQPGSVDHVGVYIGAGQMIEAPYTGANVRVANAGSFTSIRRILGADEGAGGLSLNPIENAEAVIDGLGGLADDAGSALSGLNPFDSWQEDAVGIGVKLLATTAAVALVVIGATQAVKGD
jgi:hypothetical protein